MNDDEREREMERELSLRWARNATRDRCNRCGDYYDELNPRCSGASVHVRYTAEREAKEADKLATEIARGRRVA